MTLQKLTRSYLLFGVQEGNIDELKYGLFIYILYEAKQLTNLTNS